MLFYSTVITKLCEALIQSELLEQIKYMCIAGLHSLHPFHCRTEDLDYDEVGDEVSDSFG